MIRSNVKLINRNHQIIEQNISRLSPVTIMGDYRSNAGPSFVLWTFLYIDKQQEMLLDFRRRFNTNRG